MLKVQTKSQSHAAEITSESIKCKSFSVSNGVDLNECDISIKYQSSDEDKEVQEFEENYDSDDSLGILPDQLIEDISCSHLMSGLKSVFLSQNDSVIFSGSIEKVEDPVIASHHNTDKLETSSASSMPKMPSCAKYDDSPVCINLNTPKYASTPKHETDYSYVIDEAILSPQNMPFGLELNKVAVKHGKHVDCVLNKSKEIEMKECMLPILTEEQTSIDDENINPEKNILNVTCNILKPLDSNKILLNKTFDTLNGLLPVSNFQNVSGNDKIINPIKKVDIKQEFVSSCNQFVHDIIPEDSYVVANNFDIQLKQDVSPENQNIFNMTWNILKPLGSNQILLNETFDNLDLRIACDLQDVNGQEVINPTNNVSKDEQFAFSSNQFMQHVIPKESSTVTHFDTQEIHDISSENQNILNATSTILSTSDINVTDKMKKQKHSKDTNSIQAIILNTTMSLEVGGGKITKDNSEMNTTFKKMDEPSELETKVKVLQPSKHYMNNENISDPQTVTKNKTKKSISFLRTDSSVFKNECRNKFSEFSKKGNVRKSVGGFAETIVSGEFSKRACRNSDTCSMFASSRTKETNSYKNSSIRCRMNESTRKNHSTECNQKSANYLRKNKNPILKMEKQSTDIKAEQIKGNSGTKLNGNKLLNRKLASYIPEVGKTVLKKPRCSMILLSPVGQKPANFVNETGNMFPDLKLESTNVKTKENNFDSKTKLNGNNLLDKNKNLASCIPEVEKTALKKPHSSKILLNPVTKYCRKPASFLNENGNAFPSLKLESTDIKTEEIKLDSINKLNDNNLPNKNLASQFPEVGKTVLKKPRSSINVLNPVTKGCQKPANFVNENGNVFPSLKLKSTDFKTEETKFNSRTKLNGNNLLNKDLAPHILEVGKTVLKKPRSSMNFPCKINSLESCKIPSFKTQKKIMRTSPGKKAFNTSAMMENKDIQESKKDSFSSATNIKKLPVFDKAAEAKRRNSRMPERQVHSGKNCNTNILPSGINTGTACKSYIPANKNVSTTNRQPSKIPSIPEKDKNIIGD